MIRLFAAALSDREVIEAAIKILKTLTYLIDQVVQMLGLLVP